MFKEERRKEILQILRTENYSTIEYLSLKLHASPSSIRRDVAALQKEGFVKRSYGGVEIVSDSARSLPSFAFHKQKSIDAKRKIASSALPLIRDGMVIFLDGSSCCYYLAELIAQKKAVTVITNNLDSIGVLARSDIASVYSTGGMIARTNRSVLIGSFAEATAAGIHADIFFFSPLSVSRNGTVSDDSEAENSLRRVMFDRADKRILLSHAEKLGKTSIFSFCDVGEVDCVVCDISLENWFEKEYPALRFL